MQKQWENYIIQKISEARDLYFRLILLVGPSGSGKTRLLRNISTLTSAPLININLELSRLLINLTKRQRILQLTQILNKIIDVLDDLILLDNTEILFDSHLKQDPLRLFQSLSRNKTIVVSWNGRIENNHLIYAVPGHPEYRSYPDTDFLKIVISAEH